MLCFGRYVMKHSKLNGLTGTIACFPLLAKSVALHRLIYLFKESRTAAEAEFSKDEINLKHSDASPHSQPSTGSVCFAAGLGPECECTHSV